MNQVNKILSIIFFTSLILAACTGANQVSPTNANYPAATSAAASQSLTPEQNTTEKSTSTPILPPGVELLTVMTHDSFAASEAVVAEFEKKNNAKVSFLMSGDAGAALNRAILTKGAPLADVLYGFDNTFLSRALKAGIFDSYSSPHLADIPDSFKLDSQNRALPVDYGDVCINFDKEYFVGHNLTIPGSLQEMTKPEYKGLLVVENPATSSPGLAFLLASISAFGEEGYLDYWQAMRTNDVVVVNDWSTAYYTNFSGSSGKGPQPMVVSYGSSPVAEVVFSKTPITEPPTGSIIGPNTCFRQVEFVGILTGTQKRALAEKWVDFMLRETFQNDVPLQMFVYPVNQKAVLPKEFQQFAQIPAQPAMLSPEEIDKNRETWIRSWSQVVLH
jgi:thiamine transport system substrate-binding protein